MLEASDMASDDGGGGSGESEGANPYTNTDGAGSAASGSEGESSGGGEGDGDSDAGGTAGESDPATTGDATQFDPGLLRQFADDLSRVDIQVLSAIRDINERPEDFDDEVTVPGQMPANTTSIRTAAGLSKRQVEYRVTPGERGLEEWGPNGLLHCYDPELTQTGGMGPRSAELTELGQQVLAVATGEDDVGEVAPPRGGAAITQAEFDELQASVERLTEQMEQIAPLVEQWADREWGAVDQDEAGKVSGMFKTVIQLIQTFQALGIDREVYADDDALGRETQEVLRERMVETVVETAAEEGLLGEASGGAVAGPGDVGGAAEASAPDGGGSGSGPGAAGDEGAGEREPADEDVLEPAAENEPSEAAGGDGEATGLDEFGDE